MKKALGCLRRAAEDYHMIRDGDRIAIGVSGGKDSLVLLKALHLYRYFAPVKYELCAITLDLGLGADYSKVKTFARDLGVPYYIVETQIGDIVFNIRKEKHPCALCSKMRHGALHAEARRLGCNVVALGHNRDDVLETLFMSLLYEGRFHTFTPKSYLTRRELTLIRPLIYLPEKHALHVARAEHMPVVKSPCPADGNTARETMKHLIADMCKIVPDAQQQMLHALKKSGSDCRLWNECNE